MDLSSLSQPQQQQQQHQTQQHNQDYTLQFYDPTQIQSYDQSYYSHYQQQQQPQQNQQHQQYYAYYQQPDYSNAYQHHPETVVPNPPGVSASASEGTQIVEASGSHQVQQPHEQQSAYYQGLNPAAAAAVAALSQLAQFAGNMDAAERAMTGFHAPGPVHPSAGWFPYKGGGRQGGVPFRGGGRSRSGGSSPSFHGRGRGRGRGGPKRGALLTSSHPEASASEGTRLTDEKPDPSADAPESVPEASQSTAATGKVVPNRGSSQAAWCELCRADCTSLEILEQHKNGKRHKKNLQKMEELRKAVQPSTEIQNEQKPIAESKPEVSQLPEYTQDGEENKPAQNLPTETITGENKLESEHQNNTKIQPEVPTKESSGLQAEKCRTDQSANRGRGTKRKMRGGRGGKSMKIFDGSRQPVEPAKPKVVIPLICDLCNVKCDTQEVFDCHLSGKKHIAKLKRFEGHQAMYGPMGVQALYPPNPIAQTLYHSQGHRHHQPQVDGTQGYSYPTPGAYMPTQTHQAGVTAADMDPQFQQYHTTIEYGGQNAITVEANSNCISNPLSTNSITGAEQINPATHEVASLPGNGVTASVSSLT